jgi:hypothetical protein
MIINSTAEASASASAEHETLPLERVLELSSLLEPPVDGQYPDCPICMDPLDSDSIKLAHCSGHFFHRACARQMLDTSGKCAMCNVFYVPKNGDKIL